MADPLVDIFHSRDLDSRPSQRELAALEEFYGSYQEVHIMKDHREHRVEMLGKIEKKL